MDMFFTPGIVRAMGLIPYAVYGGRVYSYKVSSEDSHIYDGNTLPQVILDTVEKLKRDRWINTTPEELFNMFSEMAN